jgi:hypothetical protein
MPAETSLAVEWALTQDYYGDPATKDNASAMVDLVRQYFNNNSIEYTTFSFFELEPFCN